MYQGLNTENTHLIKTLREKIDEQYAEILEHQRQLKLSSEKLQSDEKIYQSQIDEYKKNLAETVEGFQHAQEQINNMVKLMDTCHFPKIHSRLKQKVGNISTMFQIIDQEMNGCPVEDIQYMKEIAPIVYGHEQHRPNPSAKKYHRVCDPVWEKNAMSRIQLKKSIQL